MIAINFATSNYRFLARVRAGLTAASIMLGLLMIVMLWRSYALRTELSRLHQDLQTLESADEKVRPIMAERERLVKDLNAMSGLMDARKLSWTKLLNDAESVVPIGVGLRHVSFNSKDRVLTIDGFAQSPEALRNLVVNMEKSASYKEPYLKHQSLDKGIISFNVTAVYRNDARPDVVQGKQ